MKKALIITSSVAVLLIGAALIGPSFVDWNAFKEPAKAQITQHTGYDISLDGNIGFSVLPSPYIYVENVSIKPPAGYKSGEFVTLDRLDVSVALLPLFSGNVAVDAVSLVKPVITIEMNENGEFAGMTPEIEALTKGQTNEEPGKKTAKVSLSNISIKDGKITYVNRQGGQTMTAEAITADLSAQNLEGPFKAEGSLKYNGSDATFNVSTGTLSPEKNTSLNVQAQLSGAADLRYDGVIDYSDAIELQGETKAAITSFEKLTGQPNAALKGFEPLSLSGLLTLSPEAISLQGASLGISGQVFDGKASATRDPMNVKAEFIAKQPVNLNDLIPASSSTADKSGGVFAVLPDTLNLPQDFTADISLTAPAALYKTQSLKNVQIAFSKQDKNFKMSLAAAEIPGQGTLNIEGDLVFAAKSVSEKTGGVVFSDPVLNADVDLKTQNLSQTLDTFFDVKKSGLPDSLKSAAIKTELVLRPNAVEMKGGVVTLEGMSASVSGSYKPGTAGRDKLAIDLALDTFDTAKFFPAPKDPAQQTPLDQTFRSLALPFDLNFDIGVQTLKMPDQKIEGLRAQGTLSQNALQFTNLSAQNYAGLAVKMDGGVADLKNLGGINVNVAGESSDVKSVMQHFKMDTSSLPQNLSSANVNVSAKGDINALQTRAEIRALDAIVVAAGQVTTPLTQVQAKDLSLQIKHPNLAKFIQTMSPQSTYYSELAKPFDFSADVALDGNKTSLSNIKTSLAGTPITGAMQYDSGLTVPYLKGYLDIGELILRPVQQQGQVQRIQAQSSGRGGSAGASKWSSEPIDTAWFHSMDADLEIKAKSFVYDPWALSNAAAAISLKNGTLTVSGLKADVLRGSLQSGMTLSSAEKGKGPMRIAGNIDFQNVALEELMGNLIGTKIIRAQGLVNFKADVNAAGISQSALVSNLNGSAQTAGQNIVLDGMDLSRFANALSSETKPGDTLLGLWQGTTSGGSTTFQTLDGVFDINQGVVGIQKLDLLGPQANIKTTGAVNLPRWTLQTAHTISLPTPAGATEAPPPFTINISGPLDNPAQTFGQGAIQDYLTRKLNRKLEKVITDKIGEKFGLPGGLISPEPSGGDVPVDDGTQQPQHQQQEQTPEKAIEGLIKGLIR